MAATAPKAIAAPPSYRRWPLDATSLLPVLHETADAVHAALASIEDWRPLTECPSQYAIDVVADAAALEVLLGASLGVLSEESGLHHEDRDVIVVLDPVDGSTNASRRIPWYATSLCAVDDQGPLAALVVNQASGERFEAHRGGGARREGHPIAATGCEELSEAMIGISGYPSEHLGWYQFRALGAASLDLCAVACGRLDGYLDVRHGIHGPWDYLGGLLVCEEAGAVVTDGDGRDLHVLEHDNRLAPVAAATPDLLAQLVAARRAALASVR